MGDEKKRRASQVNISETKIGAIRVPAFESSGELLRGAAFGEGVTFFPGAELLDQWRKKVADAGLPDDFSNLTAADIDQIVAVHFGASPKVDDEKDMTASEAWALCAFAGMDWMLRQHLAAQNVNLVLEYALAIGRLVEWWRWRSQGADRAAVARQKETRKLAQGRDQVNSDVKHERRRRDAEHQRLANAIWQRNPTWSASAVAERIVNDRPDLNANTVRRKIRNPQK